MTTKKVAIITGASQGIGRAVAKGLADDGYNLILIARTKNKLQSLQKEISHLPIQSIIISCDITHTEELLKQLDVATNQMGRVDVLVNNAGIYIDGTLETSLDDYQKIFDINFKAQLVFLKEVLPVMQMQKSGHVFNIASLAGKFGYSTKGAYCSSKFALVGLSEALYDEFSKQGVKITSICPSWVATDMASDSSIPEDKMIQSDDILNTIRWLIHLSPGAFIKEVVMHTAD